MSYVDNHVKENQCYSEAMIINGRRLKVWSLSSLAQRAGINISDVPYAGRVLVESIARNGEEHVALIALNQLANGQKVDVEIAFNPARLIMQDYTGIPALVDLAAMRDRMEENADAINPVVPTMMVVDHSLLIEKSGVPDAQKWNETHEMRRNRERYSFLRWAEQNFTNLKIVPPGKGIVHQINLEQVAFPVVEKEIQGELCLIPDSVIGTDSHTTMINGLGILGWGVGGLEAEAIMLGLPVKTRFPQIVGVNLHGQRQAGVSAADLALALTSFLREAGVVGDLLEFIGPATVSLKAAERCTIANMAPEYGAMGAYFPVDEETFNFFHQTGREGEQLETAREYYILQRIFKENSTPRYARELVFDVGSVSLCVAGPSHPHQKVPLGQLGESFRKAFELEKFSTETLPHGTIALAAITSCTNTSNPEAIIAAGLLAQRAVLRGMKVPLHVKTSFAPGSTAVTRYLAHAGLLEPLQTLGFHIVGYGCTTCNGGGGELFPYVKEAIEKEGVIASSVLSGNRNFEGRIHPLIRANYLGSPAIVVAMAIAGNINFNPETDPLGLDIECKPVYLHELWPDDNDIRNIVEKSVRPESFRTDAQRSLEWDALSSNGGTNFNWNDKSTYIVRPPYFEQDSFIQNDTISSARPLLMLDDDISTDHISPVGAIDATSVAGKYLLTLGTNISELNSFGSRRSNHEVMARGAFSNERLKNALANGMSGGWTRIQPTGEIKTVYDAAQFYKANSISTIILAGERYGCGSSRDWAARGPWCLGVRAVIAKSFERIHRSNLIAMGIAPLEFEPGEGWRELGLNGSESITIEPLSELSTEALMQVYAQCPEGEVIQFRVRLNIFSDAELVIFKSAGMLPFLLQRFQQNKAN
ncbi:aconitate hydratase AcnA [Enterobacter sp. H2G27]